MCRDEMHCYGKYPPYQAIPTGPSSKAAQSTVCPWSDKWTHIESSGREHKYMLC